MTTGETAKGMSISIYRPFEPEFRPHDHMGGGGDAPNRVERHRDVTVSGDIFRAWIASGSVICLIASPIPSSKVLTRARRSAAAERSGRRARRTGAVFGGSA